MSQGIRYSNGQLHGVRSKGNKALVKSNPGLNRRREGVQTAPAFLAALLFTRGTIKSFPLREEGFPDWN
jgi:hypothetical protein